MKPIESIRNILSGLYLSLKRFPVTLLFSASTACILIIISETNPSDDTLARIAMVLALGISVSLCIKLLFENASKKNSFKLMAGYALGAVTLALYYFFLLKDFKMVEVTRYISVSLAFYLAFIYIPHLRKKQNFEVYVLVLFTSFFTTVLYSAVLYSGLSAILFAIDKLLGIRIQGEIYYYTFLFVAFIFAVSYFLAGIPLKDEDLSERTYPKLLKILLLYIVMPLISAYTTILYIYFAKIIVTRHWPVNIVTNLVLWYSVIAVFVLFFITPIITENKWANSFLKFFPKIILPVLVMMFISIAIRINAYGVTENRYYITILALWSFAVMMYLSFTKALRNIIIFISLSVLSIIAVFGPLSSYSISKLSQNKRFEGILVKNNMLKDGKIQPSDSISKKDKSDISSILSYFSSSHALNDVKYVPKNFKLDDMSNLFGFAYEGIDYGLKEQYFHFTSERTGKTIDVSGYDYFLEPVILNSGGSYDKNSLYAAYNYNSAIVKINNGGKEIYIKDFTSFIQNLTERYAGKLEKNELPAEEMTFTDENEKLKVKFMLKNISGRKDSSSQNVSIDSIDFYVLVKIK